jgi:hypothetical protein
MTEEAKMLEAQLKDVQAAARKMSDRLDAIKRAEADAKLEPLKATAARAHDLLCPYNHTDGCSWGYEGGSWQSDAHSRWLRKMDLLVNGNSYDKPKATLAEINIVLDAVADLKPKVRTALDLIRRGLIA